MAIYSFNLSNVSRTNGGNACATLAYISGERIECERLGKSYKYGHEDRIVSVDTFLPEGANEKYYNPEVLINQIENVEKNKNAITARKIIVALPRELTPAQRNVVLDDFVKNEITDRNFACVVAVHNDPEDKNPHAHILIPNRPFEKGDFAKTKRKSEYALDEKGNKIPILDVHGKQKIGERGRKLWVRVYSSGRNPLDQKETLKAMREGWEKSCNKWLKNENQIDHRSYKDRGIVKEPTIHEGYKARAMEKKKNLSDRCEYNRAVMYLRENNIDRIKTERDFAEIEYKNLLQEEKRLEAEEKTALKSPVSDEKAAGYVVIPPVSKPKSKPVLQETAADGAEKKLSSRVDDGVRAEIERRNAEESSRQKAAVEAAVAEKQPEPTAPERWPSDEIMRQIAGTWFNAKAHDRDVLAMKTAIYRVIPGKVEFSQIEPENQERLCEAAMAALGQIRRGAHIKTEETGKRVFLELLEAARVPERAPERQPEITPERTPEHWEPEPEITKSKSKDQNRGMER